MNEPGAVQATMQAEAHYFSDQLLVLATLSPSHTSDMIGPEGSHHSSRTGALHAHRREEGRGDSDDDSAARSLLRESPFPLISLRLHVRNTTPDPVEITFLDCASALGDFVVHPEKGIIPGNGTLDTEPMNSRLGITGEMIPVTVALRKAGKSEKQILALRAIGQPSN